MMEGKKMSDPRLRSNELLDKFVFFFLGLPKVYSQEKKDILDNIQ
jgi:hypothetical protein